MHGRCDGIKVEIVRVKKVSPKQAGHSEPKWEHFINTSFAPLLVPTIPYVSIYISRADEGGIGQ